MPSAKLVPVANSLLAALPRRDYQRLLPRLVPTELTFGCSNGPQPKALNSLEPRRGGTDCRFPQTHRYVSRD